MGNLKILENSPEYIYNKNLKGFFYKTFKCKVNNVEWLNRDFYF